MNTHEFKQLSNDEIKSCISSSLNIVNTIETKLINSILKSLICKNLFKKFFYLSCKFLYVSIISSILISAMNYSMYNFHTNRDNCYIVYKTNTDNSVNVYSVISVNPKWYLKDEKLGEVSTLESGIEVAQLFKCKSIN